MRDTYGRYISESVIDGAVSAAVRDVLREGVWSRVGAFADALGTGLKNGENIASSFINASRAALQKKAYDSCRVLYDQLEDAIEKGGFKGNDSLHDFFAWIGGDVEDGEEGQSQGGRQGSDDGTIRGGRGRRNVNESQPGDGEDDGYGYDANNGGGYPDGNGGNNATNGNYGNGGNNATNANANGNGNGDGSEEKHGYPDLVKYIQLKYDKNELRADGIVNDVRYCLKNDMRQYLSNIATFGGENASKHFTKQYNREIGRKEYEMMRSGKYRNDTMDTRGASELVRAMQYCVRDNRGAFASVTQYTTVGELKRIVEGNPSAMGNRTRIFSENLNQALRRGTIREQDTLMDAVGKLQSQQYGMGGGMAQPAPADTVNPGMVDSMRGYIAGDIQERVNRGELNPNENVSRYYMALNREKAYAPQYGEYLKYLEYYSKEGRINQYGTVGEVYAALTSTTNGATGGSFNPPVDLSSGSGGYNPIVDGDLTLDEAVDRAVRTVMRRTLR